MSDDVDLVPKDGDWYVKISNVTDAKTGAAITDATITVNLQTLGGSPVSGAQGLSAAYDGTTSAYWAVVPRTITVQVGQKFRAEAIVAKGSFLVPFYQEVEVVRFPA